MIMMIKIIMMMMMQLLIAITTQGIIITMLHGLTHYHQPITQNARATTDRVV